MSETIGNIIERMIIQEGCIVENEWGDSLRFESEEDNFGGDMIHVYLYVEEVYWGVAAYNCDELADAMKKLSELGNMTKKERDGYWIL